MSHNENIIKIIDRRALIRLTSIALLAFTALTGCGGGSSTPVLNSAAVNWKATWYGAPQSYSADALASYPAKSFNNQTYRQLMYISQGGTAIRVRVSNAFGTTPLVITSMHIAKSAGGSSIAASTDTALTFNGQGSVTVPVGQEVYSDSVAFASAPLSTLAISTYVAAASAIETSHNLGLQTNYVASGNAVSSSSITATETDAFFAWITEIDIQNESLSKVIVTFGDSITDGYNSTPNQNSRYPNALSRALATSGMAASVVNAGISGNRWINDGIGPNGVGRFTRDVLNVSGVTHVIALLGINDIGLPGLFSLPSQAVTSAQLITSITNAAAAAHAKGIKFYSGTLTPFVGTASPGYYSAAGEIVRQDVNNFIRTTNLIDGFIDFDAVVRDPANPTSLLATYNSGDNLHPSDAGYEAMAAAAANFLR